MTTEASSTSWVAAVDDSRRNLIEAVWHAVVEAVDGDFDRVTSELRLREQQLDVLKAELNASKHAAHEALVALALERKIRKAVEEAHRAAEGALNLERQQRNEERRYLDDIRAQLEAKQVELAAAEANLAAQERAFEGRIQEISQSTSNARRAVGALQAAGRSNTSSHPERGSEYERLFKHTKMEEVSTAETGQWPKNVQNFAQFPSSFSYVQQKYL
ncbi:hypothetical protein DFH09DRAFT_1363663 [Mycena vulgaris]|nr:hypothetical protein DFH09DRAFT_1363663 [Mycena vulgaris]